MVFSSAVFLWFFLPIVFGVNLLIKPKYSNYFLLLASLFFYAWGEPKLIVIMLFSIIFNWLIGKLLEESYGIKKKIIFIIGVSCNIGILIMFKYLAFIMRTINGLFGKELFVVPIIALPIGISFFTFQAVSYIADVYRGETEASSKFVNTALYISFFPQLIAGPIVKYRDINKQIEKRKISSEGVAWGFRRFIYGLSKKVLISNVLGLCADTIYNYDVQLLDCGTAWIGALAYTFQIYYDFSGYSDMAIGLGEMFGFSIPENFNYPYISSSINEFWRRWHISLGTWFREYVYIPLGGNRKGARRTYINLIIVFFLTGLWHGADFSFIVWGLYHGVFILIERVWLGNALKKAKVFSFIYTFLVVNFGWVFFRAPNTGFAFSYLAHMIQPWKYAVVHIPARGYMDMKTIIVAVLAVLGAGLIKKVVTKKFSEKWKGSWCEAIYCIGLLFLCLMSIASDTYNPFIYFQF